MKIGFSTNAFVKTSLGSAIESISRIGYDGVEIVLDVPHAFLPIKKSHLKNIKEHLKRTNLEVTNLNANTVVGWYQKKSVTEKFEPSLSNNNEKLRKWRIGYTQKAINMADELNAPSISITSGIAQGSHDGKKMYNFNTSVEEIATYAEKKNILIAIEYEPGLLIESYKDTLPFVANGYKNLGVNFDVCHAAVLNEDIPSVIRKFRKKLFHTHISDCKNTTHYHLIPGLGDIDFKSMYRALKEINYKGFLTAELYPYSDDPENAAEEAFNHLKNLVNQDEVY